MLGSLSKSRDLRCCWPVLDFVCLIGAFTEYCGVVIPISCPEKRIFALLFDSRLLFE